MKRLLIATPFALAIAFALFSFMAWMVDNGRHGAPQNSPSLSFNMVMVEKEQAVQRRQRSVPEQPEVPEVPPETPLNQQQSAINSVSSLSNVPALGLDTAIDGIAISAPTFGDFGVNQQAMPLYRVDPNYPPRAVKRGIEGYVLMNFTIDETGRPVQIEVVEANPRRMFEREAIRALRSWKYQPKIIDGQAMPQPGQRLRLEFKLNKLAK